MPRLAWILGVVFAGLTTRPCVSQTTPTVVAGPIAVETLGRKEAVSYAKEVSGFLESKCAICHNSTLAESRLNMEELAGMLKGGKRGPAIIRGKADQSLLFTMAAHRVEPVMPPKNKPANQPLTPRELGVLKLWIDGGAIDDSADEEAPAVKSIELGELPTSIQPINAVDITTDGLRVAAGRANLVQVYDVNSGLPIVSLGGHRDLIQSVRFSPDGSLLAAGSYQIVTVWNAPTGRAIGTLAGHLGRVLSLRVSTDGLVGYSGGDDKTIRVWRLPDGGATASFPQPAAASALALLRRGQGLLAGGSDGVIRRLTLPEGREVEVFKGHTSGITDLAILNEGAEVLSFVSTSEDATTRIWKTHRSVNTKPSEKTTPPSPASFVVPTGHRGPIRAIAITADGKLAVTGGDDGTIRAWNLNDTPKPIVVLAGHTGPVLTLAVSPDSKTILSGSSDKTARLTGLNGGKPLLTLSAHAGPVRSVGFSPGGDRLVTASEDGGLKVWDAATGVGIIAFGHEPPKPGALQPITKVAFTNEGSLVSASADSTLKCWSFSGSWTLKKSFGSHVFRVLALDFSPDGKLLATGGGEPTRSGEIKIWELGKGLLGSANDTLHSDTVFGLRFSPDGTKLASASADKFLKVTKVADGRLLRSFEGHTHHVLAVDWKSDGTQLVSGGADNVLKLWDYELGEQIKTFTAAGKQVSSVRWIPAKPEIAGACGDAQVRVWSSASGSILRSFGGPTDYVFSVATSTDGKRVAAGGSDGVLFVWDGVSGQVVRKLEPTKLFSTVSVTTNLAPK